MQVADKTGPAYVGTSAAAIDINASPESLSPADIDVLLPYQKKWIADDAQIKVAEKSRRTGLTWAEAADAVLSASAARTAGGTNHFYVGSNKEMAREFIDACALWARAFNRVASDVSEEIFIDDDGDKEILTFVVNFPNSGFKVQALSSRPSNLRGMQGNVTIDEAAFHDELAEVLKAALALTMWGAKVRLISTHNGVDNLFNTLIQDARAGKKRYSIHRVTLDDACEQGLYQRICYVNQQRFSDDPIIHAQWQWSQEKENQWKQDLYDDTATKEDAEEEYGCVPKQGGGTYMSRALIESRMVTAPVIRYEGSAEFNAHTEKLRRSEIAEWCKNYLAPVLNTLNPENQHCLGEDFARSGDLTIFAPLAIGETLRRVCPFVVELRNVPYKQQEQILFFIIDRLPRFCGAAFDSRGNGDYLAEQAAERYGSLCEKIAITQNTYLENMPRMKAAFEDDEISIPKDADLLDDLRQIQVIKGIPKIPETRTGSTNAKRHGDFAVALMLAYYASLMDVVEYAYDAVNREYRNKNSDDNNDWEDSQINTNHGFGRYKGAIL